MKQLAIDTSNLTMALAVAKEQVILGQIQTMGNKNHSVSLMPSIDYLVKSVGWKPNQIEEVLVAIGPGSYTGLRIGVTTAKTLASSLNCSLKAISSLKVLAANVRVQDAIIVPLFDARRQNVYAGAYKWQENQLVAVIDEAHYSLSQLIDLVKAYDNVHFVGQDTKKFQQEILASIPKAIFAADKLSNYPTAVRLIELAKNEVTIDPLSVVPQYLKRVEAEEKWLIDHQNEEKQNYVEKV